MLRLSSLVLAFLLLGPVAEAGEVARPASHAEYGRTLVNDQAHLMKALRRLPSAVVSLGGARIQENDPIYAVSEQIGWLLPQRKLAGRTGGGPGIMRSVPAGTKRAVRELGITTRQGRTQGINIELPFEQKLNPDIDLPTTAKEFPYRKLALYKKARGYLAFPGGYGTMDELFQFWGEKIAGKNRVPFVLVDSGFWKPLVTTLQRVTAEHGGSITKAEWSHLQVLDDPVQIVDRMAGSKAHEPVPSLATQQTNAHALLEGMSLLDRLPRQVAFIGGTTERESAVVEEAARSLAGAKMALRVGGNDGATSAVLRGAGRKGNVYGFVNDTRGTVPADLKVVHTTSDSTVHDVLMTSALQGLVATPGGLHTLRTVFSLLTQIQTQKVPRVPVVLVGTRYWTPIFATMKELMLTGSRQLIAPEDLDLVTITDDPAVVTKAFHGG